ncbi:MAG TPA: type II toxin-antitoxin system RelE/ParE family toxin, partial [Pseudonocardiaceae bacterium]
EPYGVAFSPAARRRLAKLPLVAATALYEHITGPVAGNPYRLGKPLDAPFDDVWSTRRGEYRALYIIDKHDRTITVVAVAHRRDAYRPR